MAQQRINWVDCAKGLGILCVILGHTHLPQPILTFIYSFHMPLFFLLSGIFLLKKPLTLKEELSRKARSLLLPYLFFNIILLLFFDLLLPVVQGTAIRPAHITATLQGILTGDRMHAWLWFLPCLFGAEMMLIACHRLTRHTVWVGILLMILGFVLHSLTGFPLPMSIDNMLIAAGFIAVGIGFRDYNGNGSKYSCLCLAIVYTVFYNWSLASTSGKGIDMYDSRYGNYFYFVITALAAIFIILFLFKRYSDIRPLCWLGRNSLLIYCTHTMLLQVPYAIEKRLPLFMPDKDAQAFVCGIAATLFVCTTSIPLVYTVNRYVPWILGRPSNR